MKTPVLKRDRQGSVLINTVFIVLLLVMSSFAFMRWAADESHQAEYELARTQAYYVAQYGLFDRSLTKLRQTRPSLLPQAIEFYPSGEMIHDGKLIGDYTVPSMSRESDYATSGVFGSRYYYKMQSMGTVMINSNNPNQDEWKSVTRRVSMRARLKTFSAYLYLTDEEQTVFDEIIWFYQMDTLLGPVHSNAAIGIKNRPMFYDDVTTPASDFIRGTGYNPWFHPDHPPKFNQPVIDFPWQAETLRANATRITNNNGRWQTRMEAIEGGFYYEQWELGVPYAPENIRATGTVPYGNEVGVFVEGRLELFGDDVTGQATVGSSGDMFLIDDIRYVDYSQADASADEGRYTQPFADDYPHKLGLIGEQNIFIANTIANGGGNGLYTRGNRHDGAHIVICAAIVALDERFAFRDQNDLGDDYCWCPPCPNGIGGQDERGTIYIRGTVAQRRRGYVHRSTCGGTGYEKDYLFDPRMVAPPPYFLEAVDDSVALFDIIWWQEEKPRNERSTNR